MPTLPAAKHYERPPPSVCADRRCRNGCSPMTETVRRTVNSQVNRLLAETRFHAHVLIHEMSRRREMRHGEMEQLVRQEVRD